MTFDEINTRAAHREETPDGLTPGEEMIYLTMRLVYELWGRRRIAIDEAKAIRQRAEQNLETLRTREKQWAHAETVLKLLRKNSTPEVRAAIKTAEKEAHDGD